MTADKHILPKCHRRTFGRSCSAQPDHFFSHLTVVPCQYHWVPWKSETTPCRNFHYLTETRVFTKLVMPVSCYREQQQPKQPISWESWEALSNLEQQGLGLCFGQAGKNGEEGSWVTGMYHLFFMAVPVSRALKSFSVMQWKSKRLLNAGS